MADLRRSDRKSIVTSAGIVEYRDTGSGLPVIFVHGAYLNGALWDDVAFYLPPELRLIRPDLPLGGHRLPVAADADLSAPALGQVLLDLIGAFDLHDVTLVGSDVGEAICRFALASDDQRARRIGGLLLTNCDAQDEHAPGRVADMKVMDEATLDAVAASLSTWEGRKAFFDRLVWTPLPDDEMRELLGRFVESPEVRRDALRAAAATRHPPAGSVTFAGPAKVLWGTDDFDLPLDVGVRLAAQFIGGELRPVRQARMLVPLDQPESVAQAILDILADSPGERR
jgi:pimeloyl-ACP methyl ester carboxylesterase